jgi:hypothetical protein
MPQRARYRSKAYPGISHDGILIARQYPPENLATPSRAHFKSGAASPVGTNVADARPLATRHLDVHVGLF